METSSVTSKTNLLKALLLEGWRERWTDIQWGIHIKTILPRGVSGDVYNLADIILQQALVGSWPNELLLSYLKHSLSSQDRITCRSKPEENVLPDAVLSIVYWLLFVYYESLKNEAQLKDLTEKPIIILDRLLKNRFTVALIYLAKHEQRDLFDKILKKCKEIENLSESKPFPPVEKTDILALLKKISDLDACVQLKIPVKTCAVDYSIQALLMIVVLRTPTTDTQVFVNHLLTIQQLKGYSNAKLYMEFLRACFLNMNDAIKVSEESQWGAFIFIKVPHIIQQLAFHYHGFPAYETGIPEKASQEIVNGFMLLMEFSPLLHMIDLHTSCSNIEVLLTEMVSIRIIQEADKIKILNRSSEIWKRNRYHKVTVLTGISPVTNTSLPAAIINTAKPTLSRILKTLETEYSKIQDSLLVLLSQFFNGKSFELIQAVASVKGELRKFVNGLIRFNEYSKQVVLSDPQTAYTKSWLFDITFLMLCSIVQKYGAKVIFANGYGDSFFEKWVRECMIEEDQNKASRSLLKSTDTDKIRVIILWFDSPNYDVINAPLNWDEICMAMPAVMKEIHDGWRNSILSNADVKRKIDVIRSQMCSLAVCSVSWLCSYMHVLPEDELLKPRNMVQEFLKAPNFDEMNHHQEDKMQHKGNNFIEGRCWFALQVMYHIQHALNPSMMPVKYVPSFHSLVSKDSLYKELLSSWESLLDESWLSYKIARSIETIFEASDHGGFVKFLLQELMKQRYVDELNKATDLLMALFYFDLEECTLALIRQIPHLLFKPAMNNDLIEPQSTAVARLVAYCIFASARCYDSSNRIVDTRRLEIVQDIEELCPASKIIRIRGAEEGDAPMVLVSMDKAKSLHPIISPPLEEALNDLFNTFDTVVAGNGSISYQDVLFVLRVLEQIVVCGKDAAVSILSYLPPSLVPNLIRIIPIELSMELILHLHNLNTTSGRKSAVKDLCLLHNLTIESSVETSTSKTFFGEASVAQQLDHK